MLAMPEPTYQIWNYQERENLRRDLNEEQADNRECAPVALAWEGIAERSGQREQDESRHQKPQTGKQERRQLGDADFDREIGRAPEDANDQIRDEGFTLERGHQSGSVGMKPGFSNNVDNTIVVRVFICEFGPRKSRRISCTPSRSGATTLRM